MKNSFKSKILTLMATFLFVFSGLVFFDISKVFAAVDNTNFWGITANFDANTFEGYIITVEKNRYAERNHSLFYGLGDVPLQEIRYPLGSNTLQNKSMPQNITDLAIYNIYTPILPKLTAKSTNGGYFITTSSDSNAIDTGLRNTIGKENFQIYYNNSAKSGFSLDDANSKSYEEKIALFQKYFTAQTSTNEFKSATEMRNSHAEYSNGDGDDHYTGGALGWRRRNAVFTWPSWEGSGDITEVESTYLSNLNATLTNNLNNTISMLLSHNKSDLGTTTASDSQKYAFLDFASQLAYYATKAPATNDSNIPSDDASDGWIGISYNVDGLGKDGKYGINISYKMRQLSPSEFKKLGYDKKVQGLAPADVIKIVATDGDKTESTIAIHRYPKGYANGQALYSVLSSRVENIGYEKIGYSEKVGWTHITYQSTFNYYTQGIDSTGSGDLYTEEDSGGFIGNIFASLLNFIVKNLGHFLGLYTLEELTLNTGTRGVTYWYGVFPSGWFSATQYFYLFTFTLSMAMLLIAMVRLAFQKAASTIGNVAKKISLIEGIKKLIICAMATMLFVPIFTILIQLNTMIVSTIITLIPEGRSLNFTSGMTSSTGLVGAIIATMIFWVTLKMNFTYILRGVTILICYILAPLAIMCSAVGDKFTQITSSWLRELIGNIFIQSIHALIMMLYITIAGGGGTNRIEKLVLVYSFVPLTEFIRTNLFNLGKGIDSVAENLAGGIKDMGSGVASAALMNARFKNMGKSSSTQGEGQVALNDKSSKINTEGGQKILKDDTTSHSFGANVGRGIHNAKVGISNAWNSRVGRGLRGAGNMGLSVGRSAMAVGGGFASGAMNSQGRMSAMATRTAGMTMAAGAGEFGKGIGQIANGISDGHQFGDKYQQEITDAVEAKEQEAEREKMRNMDFNSDTIFNDNSSKFVSQFGGQKINEAKTQFFDGKQTQNGWACSENFNKNQGTQLKNGYNPIALENKNGGFTYGTVYKDNDGKCTILNTGYREVGGGNWYKEGKQLTQSDVVKFISKNARANKAVMDSKLENLETQRNYREISEIKKAREVTK